MKKLLIRTGALAAAASLVIANTAQSAYAEVDSDVDENAATVAQTNVGGGARHRE